MVDGPALRIVSSNNVEIFRHLGAAQLRRTRIEHTVGATIADLKRLIAEKRPNLILLDAKLADGSGYDLCREIKNDDALRETHVIILHNSLVNADELLKSSNSGCDDVLALPLHADDFYYHLAQVTGVALRDSLRVDVEMKVQLRVGEQEIQGEVIDLGANGLGVQLPQPVPLGPVVIALVHQGELFKDIRGEVVWCNTNEAKKSSVGLRLLEVPAVARGLLSRISLFQVSANKNGDGVTVQMQGSFDEKTDFLPLLARLEAETFVDFVMQGVSYLSSSGVSAWALFLNKLSPELGYTFRNCSVAFASQASMVPMAIGRGAVLSVQAPYLCEPCGREETRLVESALVYQPDGSIVPPSLHCHVCNEALLFDDLPERYFAFLAD